jgi:OOP family OmpA-OmpF porin
MTRKVMLLALLFVLATGTSMAGGYLGASAGQSYLKATEETASVDFDGDATGWKVFGGWSFLKFLAVEAAYVDFGTVKDDTAGSDIETDATAYEAFVVGKIPIAFFEPFAKFGYANVDSEVAGTGIGASDNSWDTVYGVGVGFNFSKIHIRAEYEEYQVSPDYDGVEPDTDLYMISAGVAWRF